MSTQVAKNMNKRVMIYTDGGTVGKNGKLGTVKEVALGVYVSTTKESFCKKTDGGSNNEAEWMAFLWAMEIALKKNYKTVRFHSDSKFMINRANGHRPDPKKYPNERMDNFQRQCLNLVEKFDSVEFRHIPRENNQVADNLTNRAKRLQKV